MPKDEFDFDDPMELSGVGFVTEEDTTDAMCECFIEEFMRLGHNHTQLLALFRNPHYIGVNMVLQNRGEPYVKEKIAEIFSQWGRRTEWPVAAEKQTEIPLHIGAAEIAAVSIPAETGAIDPMGVPIPKFKL